jgi:hypothetical protein
VAAVIVALWHRWRASRRARWLLLAAAVLTADLFVGSWLLSWEIELLRAAW